MAIVGQGITAYPIPDDALNENSKNPVQNKVIAGNIKELKNNNATQDERITGLGQATTATTIGPASIATFEAPTANMPLKGLTVDIKPVQDLNGYDKPWPGGGGTNIFDPSVYFPDRTASGLTSAIMDDGTIHITGTATSANRYGTASGLVIPEGTYTVIGTPRQVTARTSADGDISTGGVFTSDGVTPISFSVKVTSGTKYDFYEKIQLNTGSTAIAWTPYSNICPITGWTGRKLHRTGISLIGGDAFLGSAFTKTDSGYELTYGGSGVSQRSSAYADITGLPAGRYNLQFINYTCPDGGAVTFRFRSPGGSWTTLTIIGGAAYGRRSFTMPANAAQIQFYFSPNTVSVGDKLTADDVVLMREEDAETPEPYKGNTYDITFPSEAGTVYGGTLDVTTGGLEVKYIKYTLTPDLQYVNNSERTNAFSVYVLLPSRAKGQLNMYCNCLKVQENARDAVVPATQIASSLWSAIIAFPKTIVSSFDDVKTKITELYNSGTPIEIVYQINQPIVYQLTLQEVTTLLGINNIWANRGDVTVTYGAYLKTIKDLVDKHDVREEQVEGTVVNLNAEPNTRYICGEVATLDITLPASGICDIVFTSGSTPTVLTVSSTVKWMHGFDPTALAADTIYELNFMDGLGVVVSWT